MPEIVLALVPHPDDAEFFAGGALARFAAAGARVHIVVATDGRRGSYIEDDSHALAEMRAGEMHRAAAALGAQRPVLLGYPDTELDRLAPGALRAQFVKAIRELRPDIVVTQDPYALYEMHPDHRAVAWAAAEAIACAHLPLVFREQVAEGLAPHYVKEKYYYGDVLPGANRIVDITNTIDRKLAALAEHRSQVVFIVEGMLRQGALAGLNTRAVFGPAAESPMALLAWGVRQRDSATGARAGVAYAEAFRYERYHALVEAALEAQAAKAGGAGAPA